MGKTVEVGLTPLRWMLKVLVKKAAKAVLVFRIHLGKHARHLLKEIVSRSLFSSWAFSSPRLLCSETVGPFDLALLLFLLASSSVLLLLLPLRTCSCRWKACLL